MGFGGRFSQVVLGKMTRRKKSLRTGEHQRDQGYTSRTLLLRLGPQRKPERRKKRGRSREKSKPSEEEQMPDGGAAVLAELDPGRVLAVHLSLMRRVSLRFFLSIGRF
jgi:hypothetical protein